MSPCLNKYFHTVGIVEDLIFRASEQVKMKTIRNMCDLCLLLGNTRLRYIADPSDDLAECPLSVQHVCIIYQVLNLQLLHMEYSIVREVPEFGDRPLRCSCCDLFCLPSVGGVID